MSRKHSTDTFSQHAAQRAVIHSTLNIVWRSLAVLLVTEALVKLLIASLGIEPQSLRWTFDSVLTAAISLPLLYTAILRPVSNLAAQQAAAAAEQRFCVVAQSIQDGVVVAGEDERILFANAAAERMHGYARGELRGVTVRALMGVETLGEFIAGAGMATADAEMPTPPPGVFEGRGRRKNGEEFDIELSVSRVSGDGSRQYVTVVRETTERKRMEAALRQSERQFRELLESLPVAVRMVRNGRVTYANRADAAMFGFGDPSEEVGTDALLQVAEEERQRVTEIARRRAEGREAPGRYEATLLRHSGEHFPAEITSRRIETREGTASLNVVRDLSEQKKLQMYERILPVCCVCGKIRDDTGAVAGGGTWGRLDHYVAKHSDAQVSHTFCPECLADYRKQEGLEAK